MRDDSPEEAPTGPDKPIDTVAERLAKHGLMVKFPEYEDSRLIKITDGMGAHCEMTISDDYDVACELAHPRNAGPAQIAPVVGRMLSVDYSDPGRYSVLHQEMTLVGAVGREMKARGLDVVMEVIRDDEIYRVSADLIITNSDKPGRGSVHVDDGWVYWECDASELFGGTAELADTIANILATTPRS
jgi:hypothetical protein